MRPSTVRDCPRTASEVVDNTIGDTLIARHLSH